MLSIAITPTWTLPASTSFPAEGRRSPTGGHRAGSACRGLRHGESKTTTEDKTHGEA